jgi:hypothetical protein
MIIGLSQFRDHRRLTLTGDADITFDIFENVGIANGKNEYSSATVSQPANNILAIDLNGEGGIDITADFSLSGGGAVRNLAVSFDLVESGSGDSSWDIESSLAELKTAKITLRTIQTKFFNSLNVITTRSAFADQMINALEEGIDNLINADMNEESAIEKHYSISIYCGIPFTIKKIRHGFVKVDLAKSPRL